MYVVYPTKKTITEFSFKGYNKNIVNQLYLIKLFIILNILHKHFEETGLSPVFSIA